MAVEDKRWMGVSALKGLTSQCQLQKEASERTLKHRELDLQIMQEGAIWAEGPTWSDKTWTCVQEKASGPLWLEVWCRKEEVEKEPGNNLWKELYRRARSWHLILPAVALLFLSYWYSLAFLLLLLPLCKKKDKGHKSFWVFTLYTHYVLFVWNSSQ